MTARRKKNGADEVELIIILAAVGGLGYLIYRGVATAGSAIGTAATKAAASVTSAAAGMAPTQTLNVAYQAVIPGTGHTVSELLAIGYTVDQINQMSAEAIKNYGTPTFMQQTPVTMDPIFYPFANITGWLTGS